MGKGIGAFIIGGLVGAGIALLYAPRAGEETRNMVSAKVSETWGQAQEFGAQAGANAQQAYHNATEMGQEVYSNVSSKGHELYETATSHMHDAANSVKPVFAEKNDELREKIEAARQRIASQVARNAEVAQDTANSKISVVADAIEDVADVAQDALEEAVDTAAEKTKDINA